MPRSIESIVSGDISANLWVISISDGLRGNGELADLAGLHAVQIKKFAGHCYAKRV
jgi:hypothetical protein